MPNGNLDCLWIWIVGGSQSTYSHGENTETPHRKTLSKSPHYMKKVVHFVHLQLDIYEGSSCVS